MTEDIFIEIPEFFKMLHPELEGVEAYLKLKKSLYSLKQAPRAWLLEVLEFFKKLGLRQLSVDPNLFIRTKTGVYILLFVNNMLTIGKRKQVNKIKS